MMYFIVGFHDFLTFLSRFRMFEKKKVHITTRYFMSAGLIIACLTGVILAQTFHYSRGWTNGKKRAPLTLAVYDSMQEPESFGLCKMQTLKHILENKHRSEVKSY